jgi:nitrogen-specific signal transduction histidine kinase
VQLEQQLIQSQKLEALGTLASGFAHDFNNLLAGLFSYISVLRMQATSEEMHNSINVIDDISKKATVLVKQILTFSRSSKIHAQPVSLKSVADDVLTILSRSIPDNITVVNTIPDEPPPVLGDPSQLSQVLLNLIINARDAMPDGGELRLEFATEFDPREIPEGVENRDHMARITVSDTGTGIDPDIRPKIFDPFFTTKSKGKGTGLGLSTVYGILRNHKGGIEVNSAPGQGTMIEFYLPLADPSLPPQEEATPPPPRAEAAPDQGTAPLTILIIDDEEVICNALRDGLSRMGYAVLTAESGERGIELYREQGADLIILDMIMQGLSGRRPSTSSKKSTRRSGSSSTPASPIRRPSSA